MSIKVVIIHQNDWGFFDRRIFKAITTVTAAMIMLVKAMTIATIPRLVHPKVVFGKAAFIKNNTENIIGSIMWKITGCLLVCIESPSLKLC